MNRGVSLTELAVITHHPQNRTSEETRLRRSKGQDPRLSQDFHGEVPHHGPND
jgi:hypothetical protein